MILPVLMLSGVACDVAKGIVVLKVVVLFTQSADHQD